MKASVVKRIEASIIDNVLILALLLGAFLKNGMSIELAYKYAGLIFWIYVILVEYFTNGYQLGKYLVGIRIGSDKGKRLTFLQCVLREFSKMIYLIPIVGIILALISGYFVNKNENGKAVHDIIMKTTVLIV